MNTQFTKNNLQGRIALRSHPRKERAIPCNGDNKLYKRQRERQRERDITQRGNLPITGRGIFTHLPSVLWRVIIESDIVRRKSYDALLEAVQSV